MGGPCLQNYLIVLSYDGTAYHGFQSQKNALAIQDVLERGLEKLYRKKIRVEAAGRTDAGVHARGQVVNYFAPAFIPTCSLPLALNSVLPRDIIALEAKTVSETFNARRDASSKIYSYQVDNGFLPDVFLRHYAWHVSDPLDLNKMKLAASFLTGRHDFKAFQAAGSSVETTERTIYALEIEKKGHLITFTFKGNGFLYKMVRNITGTLVEIGLAKRDPQVVPLILKSKDRKEAGATAPARGLCLEKVIYPDKKI